MEQLIAKKSHRYGGKSLRAGQTYEAKPKHARLLKAIGKAETAPEELEADQEEAEGTTGKPRGRYQRRDMRAQD